MVSMSSLGPAPGLAPPAAGVPAWRVTLFLSFPLYPRKCPIAGHLHGAASLFLAQPLILYVFWLNHPAWRGFPEPTASARVPLSFSPGSLPAVVPALPSCLSPAHWLAALQPSPLSAVSLAVDLTLVAGACFPFSSSQRSRVPGSAAHPALGAEFSRCGVQTGWGCREGRRHRGAGAGLAATPAPGMSGSHQLKDWGQVGGSRRTKRRKKAGNRGRVGK